ncbi:MAG: adenosylcobinamide-GDP ribazoletransferase [Eubacteriales bacterium]|nr:adenosylcobinamide-GDP ribazoletransferase [Eubacteriales bacterium]
MGSKQHSFGSFWRGLCCSFSTYSLLPPPGYRYREGDLAYCLASFPLVGFCLGLFSWLLLLVSRSLAFSAGLFAAFNFALQAILTGAIHLDGFADAADGIWSRRDRERMLEIMHDPHIGPMAVIALIVLAVVDVALEAELAARAVSVWRLGLSFALLEGLTRTQTAALILRLPSAREDGMAKSANAVQAPKSELLVWSFFVISSLALLCVWGWTACFLPLAVLLATYAFARYTLGKFSGMTGDLAGYYLCLLVPLTRLLLLLIMG